MLYFYFNSNLECIAAETAFQHFVSVKRLDSFNKMLQYPFCENGNKPKHNPKTM